MIDYATLAEQVGGTGVGIRARTALVPLGGPGEKVFPPTYGVDQRAETRYAVERRRRDGQPVEAVVLDSVASQANRMELALLEAVRTGALGLPLVSVDFSGQEGLAGLDRISSLETPHRIFDALLRDARDRDVLFRFGPVGRAITEATHRNAAALFRHNPATLLFGGWDSTGPKGGRGSKYERTITSEIVAYGIERGVATSSRLDPVGIERDAGVLYEAADKAEGGWTLDPEGAVTDKKGDPVPLSGGPEGGAAGRPSQANHGNITPSIVDRAGGVTADAIEATTVLSFAALRRLRFPVDGDGTAIPPERRREAESAAWTALAAPGIAAAALTFGAGFDLRSRCALYAESALTFELLGRPGETSEFTAEPGEALDLVAEAVKRAGQVGLDWHPQDPLLTPTGRLSALIRRSRAPAETGATGDDGAEVA